MRAENIMKLISALFAAFAVISVITSFFFISKNTTPELSYASDKELVQLSARMDHLQTELQILENLNTTRKDEIASSLSQMSILAKQFQSMQSMNQSVTGSPTRYDLLNLNKNLSSLDNRLSLIEKAIIDSPERSLALYKLSDDLDNFKKIYDLNVDELKKNDDRLYSSINYLFAGFMASIVTISLGFIGFLWAMQKEKKKQE